MPTAPTHPVITSPRLDARDYHDDADGLLPGSPDQMLHQSLARLAATGVDVSAPDWSWLLLPDTAPFDFFPRPEEIHHELLPIARQLSAGPVLTTVNLSASTPVAFPKNTSPRRDAG